MKLNSLLQRYIKRFSLSNIKPKTVYLGIFILLACFIIFKFFIKPNVVEGFITNKSTVEEIKTYFKYILLLSSNEDFFDKLIKNQTFSIDKVNKIIDKSFNTTTFFIGTGDKNKIVTNTFFDIYFQDNSYKEFITAFTDINQFRTKILKLIDYEIPELYYKDLNEEEWNLLKNRIEIYWLFGKNMNDIKEKYNKEINKIIKTIPNSLKTQSKGQITIPTTSKKFIEIKKILNQLIRELQRDNNNLKIQFLLKNQHYINFAEVEKRKKILNMSYQDISGNVKTSPYTDISGNVNTSFKPMNSPSINFDNDIIGDYEINPSMPLTDNDYNHVTITKSSEGIFKWTIRGSLVSWNLYKNGTNTNYLIVGNDCPYYNNGYTKATIFRPTSANNVVGIEGPEKFIYYKKNKL